MISVVIQGYMSPNPEWKMISTSAAILNASNSFIPIAGYDLINENGTYVNVQGMSFNFYYERAPGFAESTLIIPLILIFIGKRKS